MSLTAIVLCGGRSTRMGQDKGSLRFGDETMLERVVRITRSISDDVIVVGRQDQNGMTAFDAIEHQGPLAGIVSGLAVTKSELNLVVACDTPLLNPVVLQRMVTMIEDYDACVAMIDGHASALCGVYRTRIAGEAQALFDSGERRVMALLDRIKTKRVDAALFRDIDPNLDTFVSCDTPEAYQAALKTLRP